jgi:molecular chaperone GrpE
MNQPEDDTADSGASAPDLDVITEQAARIAELEALRLQALANLDNARDEQAARIAELEALRLQALADLDNARKRCATLVSRAEAEARAAVARQWLAVVDNLDLALEHAEADPVTIVDGVRAVRAQALNVLARLGFPRRDDRGARFDPARHEAVATRPDPEAEADVVAEVVRPAYGEGDHQLRPAQVVVARPGLTGPG